MKSTIIKNVMLIALGLGVSLSTYAQVKKKTAVIPKNPVNVSPQNVVKTSLDSLSYAFGLSMARDLKSRGITELNYSLVSQAMNDGFKSKTLSLSPEQCQKIVYNHLSSLNKKKYEGGIAEGNKFLEDNKSREGVITLPSGLQYQVLTPAAGDKPKATDEVTVHYKGSLMNGQQFDSSYDRNEPATFRLNGVIPGWTEGVQLMPVGSKYKFFIPYQLAYGANGAGQDIPPYSVLIFEIELIKVGK